MFSFLHSAKNICFACFASGTIFLGFAFPRRISRRCVYLFERGNSSFLILARGNEESGTRKFARNILTALTSVILKSIIIRKTDKVFKGIASLFFSLSLSPSLVSRFGPIARSYRSFSSRRPKLHNNIREKRNRDRGFRAKNLNFQISCTPRAVCEIFYDYRELLYIQRSAYFTSGNTNVGGETWRSRVRESEDESERERKREKRYRRENRGNRERESEREKQRGEKRRSVKGRGGRQASSIAA